MVPYGCIFIGVSPGIAPGLARILTSFFAQKKERGIYRYSFMAADIALISSHCSAIVLSYRLELLTFINEAHLRLLLCILLRNNLKPLQSVTLRTQCSKFDRLTADLTINAGNRLACLSLILDPSLADPLSDLRDRYIKVFRHIKFPHIVLTDEILYLCKQIRLPAARTDIVLLVDIRQNTSTLRTPRCIRK